MKVCAGTMYVHEYTNTYPSYNEGKRAFTT